MSTNPPLHLEWKIENDRFCLLGFGTNAAGWIQPGSVVRLFRVIADDQKLDATILNCRKVEELHGIGEICVCFTSAALEVDYHILFYPDLAVLEVWPVLRAIGEESVHITRVDSVVLPLIGHGLDLFSFTGDWGSEFEPQERAVNEPIRLQSQSGRSSKGNHPWFALRQPDGRMFSAAPVWSGNWIFRFDPQTSTTCELSGGLSDWKFAKTLAVGEQMEGVHVVLVWGDDLNQVSQQYAAAGRRYWYPRCELSARQPVEWNHWWPYEDLEINEQVFSRNVEAAARLGMEVCTLDAGWFGPSEASAFWNDYRGDWHLVNQQRFPHGIRALSDLTHSHGMAFGIWCEIEGLGGHAQLALDHPDFPATRDGERLGYVCFGNPAVQEWAYQTLSRLITEYRADWIKLDFNLDPGSGCDRTDHGHQAGDGLYEHVLGYYHTLERIRAAYPQVVLENCSSGGLRIDLGMLRHTDMTFLSDPDWPVHDLQIFWGASTHLAPDVLLHWGYSDWRNTNPPPEQRFDPRDPALTPRQFDYYTRISMLGLHGYSQKLPDLPDWMAERVALHTRHYQQVVRRFIREGDLFRLTAQPRRSGEGERWAAFQYSLPDASEHLLFVFRLPGGEPVRTIYLLKLDPQRIYTIAGLEGRRVSAHAPGARSGRELMELGLTFTDLLEEDSSLLRIA